MGILSIIFLIIGAIIVVLLIAAALSSDDYAIETDIVINKPVATVFNYVKYLENQGTYNKWVMIDPNVRKTFKGTDGTVGFFYAWESDNKQVGKGEQTITGLTDNKKVDYHLRFIEPFQGEAESYIATEGLTNGQTKVTWAFFGKRNFMMKLMHIVLNLKKTLKKDLHTSLTNLKTVLEQ
ncbi:SRPBCC family protein [Mucilaginibacter boryungensis]|uniref:SRPBCC family protein n=1 Tax=Mucilaginibacter boryungensis TaxID=768480 RepID=A0ABR9XMP4_9SPHI|nr:SRPBCC family protein [Mucilaginibacter boryungensis]MBE9668654.1 SRPBCC family protein [Mucilaginibacter boryungensis]